MPTAMLAPSPRLAVIVLSLAIQSGCAPSQAAADPASPAAAAPAPDAAPAAEHSPDAAPTPEPASGPALTPAPTVDLATVASVRFKIVAIPERDRWVACGKQHNIGALEVEVLDADEPPPRMLLLVSCPTGVRDVDLAVGATLTATLHAREQPWPTVQGLPVDLPRRQVASFEPQPSGDPK